MRGVFNEEHEAYRDAARRFVEAEMSPYADEWEDERDFPRELFAKTGAAGFFGAKFDPEWGGTGPDYAAEAVWIEEISKAGVFGAAMDLGAHSQLSALYIDRFGNADQKERYLRPSIEGRMVGALGVTEPGAGSDVNAAQTRARRDGEEWVLNGSKIFITNGAWSDYTVVSARTSDDPGHDNLTLFIIDTQAEGYSSSRLKMIGWQTSHTGEISMSDVRVPDSNRLGDVGAGFKAIMENFQWERVIMSLGAVALAELALETAVAYARERTAFGRPILKFQVWQHRFADAAVRIRLGKALTYRALALHIAAENGDDDARADLVRLTTMAKLYTQRMAWEVADECVQVHGGSGALMEYRAQRYWRDARVGPIGGGTDDIMRNIIAKQMGLGAA